jgi:hypothetical protein
VKSAIRLLIISCCFTTLLNGCTLEDETEEKIITPPPVISSDKDKNSIKFIEITKKCALGDLTYAPISVYLYNQSLPQDAFAQDIILPSVADYKNVSDDEVEPFLYQTYLLNNYYEKCLQKAAFEGLTEYRDYYVTRPRIAALISRFFYSKDDYSNGAYWARRVVNYSGVSQGNYILGRVFIGNDKTRSIGADLLKESAKKGNVSAKQFLSDSVINNNVFDLLNSKEQEKVQQSHSQTND